MNAVGHRFQIAVPKRPLLSLLRQKDQERIPVDFGYGDEVVAVAKVPSEPIDEDSTDVDSTDVGPTDVGPTDVEPDTDTDPEAS